MTKQEEIKKIATTMGGYYNDGKCIFRNCAPCDKFNSQECSYKEDAEELYYAGYRKADEVRKETAKEIFGAIINNRDEVVCILIKYNKWFQSLAKQHGVEVDG